MLFGSQARGDKMPGSDIDVLVVLKGPVRPGEEIRRTVNVDIAVAGLPALPHVVPGGSRG